MSKRGLATSAPDEIGRVSLQAELKPVTTTKDISKCNGMAESFVKIIKRDFAKLAPGKPCRNDLLILQLYVMLASLGAGSDRNGRWLDDVVAIATNELLSSHQADNAIRVGTAVF